MLKVSTRIFAASALAAMLVVMNQGAFAHEKTTKAGAKTAAACAMCAQKEGVAKVAAKGVKPVVKTTINAKMAPKVVAKTVALKTGAKAAVESCPMCAQKEAKAKS